jgi:hypothetical protein
VFLQPDRDRTEAGLGCPGSMVGTAAYPRSTCCSSSGAGPSRPQHHSMRRPRRPGHTCDLHRQQELLDDYTGRNGTPTILWNKDRRLPIPTPLRRTGNVAVCKPALHPMPGTTRLLFPVADTALDDADATALARTPRPLLLAYVGNQPDRETTFGVLLCPAAALHHHLVAGKVTPHRPVTARENPAGGTAQRFEPAEATSAPYEPPSRS